MHAPHVLGGADGDHGQTRTKLKVADSYRAVNLAALFH
jgi:hypothetical protein